MIEDNKRIAIVILNYNGLNLLKKFLPSVVNFSDYKISSIYLVDNCSKDDSIRYVKNKFPKINIIENDNNLGYSEGYNQGLKQIKSDYYILLFHQYDPLPYPSLYVIYLYHHSYPGYY